MTMCEPKFTNGPWAVSPERPFEILTGDGSALLIATVETFGTSPEQARHDAYLIGAAPDLYAALALALPYVQKVSATSPTEPTRMQRQMKASCDATMIVNVLAKARGE
jgi:hypothetical protein